MNDHLYKQFSYNADQIAAGHLEDKLKEMLKADYLIQSTHTVRASDGDDILVIIFQSDLLTKR